MKTSLRIFALGSLFLAAAHAAPVAPTLKNDLVALNGKKAKRFDDAALATTKYFAVYYSAHWCPPCRTFTPVLVQWYAKTKAAHPEFELIFVSNDRSEKDMEGYMAEAGMPWPALEFSKVSRNKSITQYAGSGIPCLVFIDAEGKVLSHSYEGAKYVGPSKVLRDIDKILGAGPGSISETASSAAGSTAAKAPPSAAGSNFDSFFKKQQQP